MAEKACLAPGFPEKMGGPGKAPHDAVGSTTAGLLCASENHCTGSRRLVFPAPYDAVGGTDDGIGPNCKVDDDLMGRHHLGTPTAQAVNVWSPMDPQDAVGGIDDGLGPTPKLDDDPMGTPQPWEWHLQMTPSPRQGHGQYKSRP
ncbi:E3 Ubiquitin-Protein Ligase Rnf31 [Manis pentadactyla]|nr:E3 Ubiquitin-Protein Ligase Rnf31 [Manis pentadactyla]